MLTTHRLATALGLVLGTAMLAGAAQAQDQEQGLRPLPEDLATQADKTTSDTMPFPENAPKEPVNATDEVVQDATLPATGLAEEDGDVSPEDDLAADTAGAMNGGMEDASPATRGDSSLPADATSPSTAAAPATHSALTAPSATLEQAQETRFASGDKDGNGSLSAAELTALDDDDLEFATLDSDADGAITRAEWSAHLSAHVADADDDE